MTDATMMKAVVFHRYGSPETLSLREVPVPLPAPGEIRVRVLATTVGRTDTATLRADPFFARAMTGIFRPKMQTLGDGVIAFQPGDRVSKANALERLRGQRSAFERPGGAILAVVADLQAGHLGDLRERFRDFQVMRGIRGLPDRFEPTGPIFELLRDIYQDAEGNANVRSGVFSATARLDELENVRQLE